MSTRITNNTKINIGHVENVNPNATEVRNTFIVDRKEPLKISKTLRWKAEKYATGVYYQSVSGGYELDKEDIKDAYLQGVYDTLTHVDEK